jgi:hypothetical protein
MVVLVPHVGGSVDWTHEHGSSISSQPDDLPVR